MARPHTSPVVLLDVKAALGTADTLVEPTFIRDAGIPSARLATCTNIAKPLRGEHKGLHIRRFLHLKGN